MKRRYGCVQCQRHHYEGDALFNAHYGRQDKHGVQFITEAAWAMGRMQEYAARGGRREG